MPRPPLKIILASPRGFCAGVDRAIHIVERSLEQYGAPVYVRHEIVHNRYVVESLQDKGAVFVDDLSEVPNDRPVVFSAHGVPRAVPAEANRRNLLYVDAICPLVSKVHAEAKRHSDSGRQIILIGHSGHAEVTGIIGQVPCDRILLVENAQEAQVVTPANPMKVAYVTQTTLSVDDTADIVTILKQRFPFIKGPSKEDICYATTNRQEAVKLIAERCDKLIVLGSPNSSNSQRLVEVAYKAGCRDAELVQRASDVIWEELPAGATLGLTAGASAPELLVQEVVDAAKKRFSVTLEHTKTADEEVKFNLPKTITA